MSLVSQSEHRDHFQAAPQPLLRLIIPMIFEMSCGRRQVMIGIGPNIVRLSPVSVLASRHVADSAVVIDHLFVDFGAAASKSGLLEM